MTGLGDSPRPARATPAVTAILLRLVLALVGAFVMFTAVNVALGGFATLGWQGTRDFFAVTDESAFQTQDSHVRFFGGVWFAIGVTFACGAVRPDALRRTLLLNCALIFVGGLSRLSATDGLLEPTLVGSFLAELIGMPLLGLWLWRLHRRTDGAVAA